MSRTTKSELFADLPRTIAQLTNLAILDLENNEWNAPEFSQQGKVSELLKFIGSKTLI